MSNFANCRTCEYKHTERGDGHCYMFKEEPTDTCRKHKLLKSEKEYPVATLIASVQLVSAHIPAVLMTEQTPMKTSTWFL